MADLPKEPITRQEEYLSRLAGEDTTLPREPITREEMYLEGAIGRVEAVEEEVEELKNNPDVADIVATYADLQAYDTSKLTDKDVIRVLADETHDGDSTYYRYSKSTGEFTYIGESKQYVNFVGTDGQTAGKNGLVPAPAVTDAGKFLNANGLWEAVQSGGGGGFKTLTAEDKNWPTNNPTGIALWKLEPGIYRLGENGLEIWFCNGDNASTANNSVFTNWRQYLSFFIVRPAIANENPHTDVDITAFSSEVSSTYGYLQWRVYAPVYYLLGNTKRGALESEFVPLTGAGAPTVNTFPSFVGETYIDTTNQDAYVCVKRMVGDNIWKKITP